MKISWGDKPKVIEPIFYEISKLLLGKKDNTYREYLNYKLEKYLRIHEELKGDTENSRKRKLELWDKIQRIKGFLLE